MRRRGWLLASTLLVVVAFGASATVLWRPAARALAWSRLRALAGQDLARLPAAERAALEERVRLLFPEAYEERERALSAWLDGEVALIAPIAAPAGEPRWLLVLLRHLVAIPGDSGATVLVLDAGGRLLGRQGFSTGWRMNCERAEVVAGPRPGLEVLRIDVGASIGGAPVWQQVYALTADDRLALVRLTEEGGAFFENSYRAPNHTIGPLPPDRTLDGWVTTLEHGDWASRLEALLWVGGGHARSDEPRGDVLMESVADSARVEAVRADPRARALLERLASSDADAWTAEAARHARERLGE